MSLGARLSSQCTAQLWHRGPVCSAIRCLILSILAVLALAAPAMAVTPRAGSIDRSFGGGDGRVQLGLPGDQIWPSAMEVQPDGKLVVVGTLIDKAFAGRALAIRFLRDGQLDPTFGSGGVARISMPLPLNIRGVTFDSRGRLLLTGSALLEPGVQDPAVVRLLEDGAVDDSFGPGGLVTVVFDDAPYQRSDAFTNAALEPDGRIVVAGSRDTSWPHENGLTLVSRLLPDGRLDDSFDGDGRAWLTVDVPADVVIGPDATGFVLGWNQPGLDGSPLWAFRFGAGATRMPPSGGVPSPDWALYPFSRPATAVAGAILPDGNVLIIADVKRSERFRLASVRVDSDLRELRRRYAASIGVQEATFDARGALLTASEAFGSHIFLERHRGADLARDQSFGFQGQAVVNVRAPATVIGSAIHDDRLVVAAYTGRPLDEGNTVTLTAVHAHQDGSGPIVQIRRLPRHRCGRGLLRPLIRIRDESDVRVEVRVDRRAVRRSHHKRIRLRLDTGRLSPGPHKLVITARDAAGNLGRRSSTFTVCARS
jgi:uncharacterized delta-60 repeat protein